jgi:CheY-like chemotaxis protein
MAPSILVAGLDARNLLLDAPVLRRERDVVEEKSSARAVLDGLAREGGRLVVLGPSLPDLTVHDTVRRIRALPATRQVSILVLLPDAEGSDVEGAALDAGANAVLRLPLDPTALDDWIAKLLSVPRRVETRVPVQGQVVGTPKNANSGHFYGLTRNLSAHGMLLASPVRLADGYDVDLEFHLPPTGTRVRALGRVVREAAEVGWPYVGYGVEFLYVPPESLDAIVSLVTEGPPPSHLAALRRAAAIHSTVRRASWVYEIHEPTAYEAGWMVEIRRAPREEWRPGAGGPFYVVEGSSPENALRQARDFLYRQA